MIDRNDYRHALIKLLTDADRLGCTPDDLAARAVVLAELRHAITAGLVEEPVPTEQRPTPSDDDGWIPWSGGECPCPDWPEVEYECRSGYHGTRTSLYLNWRHEDCSGDIIAYRRPRP